MEAGKVDIIMPEEPKKIELIKPEESLINTITTKNDENDELSILLDRLIEKRLKEKETLFLQNPATPTMKDQVLTNVVSTMILSVIPMMLPLTIRLNETDEADQIGNAMSYFAGGILEFFHNTRDELYQSYRALKLLYCLIVVYSFILILQSFKILIFT